MNIPQTYNGKSLIHSWTYRDTNGEELGYVARYQNGTDKKDIVPFFKQSSSGFTVGIELNPRPLFGLNMLATHPKDKAVFVVEGEKPAAALQSAGIAAVSSLGGSQAAKLTDWTPLNGYKIVYLLPDNDAPGENYMQEVYAALMALELPPQVKLLRLLGLPDKGDIVDWLQSFIRGWDGFKPLPEQVYDEIKDKLRAELQKSESVPESWTSSSSESTDSGWENPYRNHRKIKACQTL